MIFYINCTYFTSAIIIHFYITIYNITYCTSTSVCASFLRVSQLSPVIFMQLTLAAISRFNVSLAYIRSVYIYIYVQPRIPELPFCDEERKEFLPELVNRENCVRESHRITNQTTSILM